MGKRGPAPKPTALRLLHGDRADRINTAEPIPPEKPIEPPDWLSEDALAVWDQYAQDLHVTGVLTAWDVEAFACFCDAAARRRRAVAHVEAEGEVVQVPVLDKSGEVVGARPVRNPWALVLVQADSQVQRYGARFGLTPSDRAQLRSGGGGGREPGEDLLT